MSVCHFFCVIDEFCTKFGTDESNVSMYVCLLRDCLSICIYFDKGFLCLSTVDNGQLFESFN